MPVPVGLLAGGSALLGGLSGFISGNSEEARIEALKRELMALLSDENFSKSANSIFSLFKSSPMYTGMRSSVLQNAGALGNRISTGFARAGLSRSGLGQVGTQIGKSFFAPGLADIDANLFTQAAGAARDLLGRRADVIGGLPRPAGGVAGGFAGGIEALMPFIDAYLKKNYQTSSGSR